MTVIINIVTH